MSRGEATDQTRRRCLRSSLGGNANEQLLGDQALHTTTVRNSGERAVSGRPLLSRSYAELLERTLGQEPEKPMSMEYRLHVDLFAHQRASLSLVNGSSPVAHRCSLLVHVWAVVPDAERAPLLPS